MIRSAFLEEQGQGRQEPELALLASTLPHRGIQITLLVEVNDGFSLGSYGLAPEFYTDLTIARWEELVEGKSTSPDPNNI